jgi:hypothetical protein
VDFLDFYVGPSEVLNRLLVVPTMIYPRRRILPYAAAAAAAATLEKKNPRLHQQAFIMERV